MEARRHRGGREDRAFWGSECSVRAVLFWAWNYRSTKHRHHWQISDSQFYLGTGETPMILWAPLSAALGGEIALDS